MRRASFKRSLRAVRSFIGFFLATAFIVTCSTMLFLTTLQEHIGFILTEENINVAAKLTFINVVFLSLAFTLIDIIRHELTDRRAVDSIAKAAKRIVEGDFSVRIEDPRPLESNDDYREIINCFNRMAQELSGVETLQSDFISNVSHEMKTPLAVIGNYAKLLEDRELSESERAEYARGIREASIRLSDMVTNILKLSKLENKQIFPKSEEFDLSEQLRLCLLQYESIWERKNIEIETDIRDGVKVRADEELLSLVWNNLLSNAFKFTQNGGKVSLVLSSCDDFISVTVSDTGCGMPCEVGAHIFEKFYQGDGSHATEGNGLGLTLVKRVVDIIGGDISVESRVGLGSRFTVKLWR